jgi:hypothetical protein
VSGELFDRAMTHWTTMHINRIETNRDKGELGKRKALQRVDLTNAPAPRCPVLEKASGK